MKRKSLLIIGYLIFNILTFSLTNGIGLGRLDGFLAKTDTTKDVNIAKTKSLKEKEVVLNGKKELSRADKFQEEDDIVEVKKDAEEIYVTLKVNKLRNDFFPLLELDGEKYIAIEDFIDFMDLQLLEVTSDNRIVGELGEKRIDKSFDFDSNIEYQEKTFVSTGNLKEVFPLNNTVFYEDTYTLVVTPNFKLPFEIAKEVLERRRDLAYSGDEVEKIKVHTTPKKLFDLGIVSAEYEKYDFGRGEDLLTLGYASQLLYGDFNISGDVVDETNLNYVNLDYEDVEFLGGKNVRFGDFYLRTYSQLPVERTLRGISISGNDTYGRRDNDSIIIDGEARGAETVEIYQNGILIEYDDVENDIYSFEIETITNDDEYLVKTYYPSGRTEEKTMYVLSDSQIFPKGNWDYIVQAGRGTYYDEDQAMFNVKYGVTNNLTLGVGASSFSDQGDDYDIIEGNFAYRTGAWIFPSMLIGDYFYNTADEDGTLLLTFTQKIGDYTFDIDYNNYGDSIADRKGEDQEFKVSFGRTFRRINWRARHSWERYEGNDYQESEFDIYYRRNKYRVYALNTYENPDGFDDLYTLELGLDYTGNKYLNLNLNTQLRSDGEQANSYGIRLSRRDRMGEADHYIDLAGELEYDEDDQWIASLELTYYFDKFMRVNLPITVDTEDTAPDLGISIEKAIALKDPIGLQHIKDRDTFWVVGKVFRDSNGNGTLDTDEEVMQNVGLNIGGKEVFTKSDGSFLAQNIRAGQDVRVSLIRETIDPTLDTAVEKIYVRGSIAEEMRYDIPLLPLSSVGGYINLGNEDVGNSFIFSKTIIEFLQDGKVKYTTSPEADGFFIIDTILPGEYDVEVNYLGIGKKLVTDIPLILAIPKNRDGDYYEVEYNLTVEEESNTAKLEEVE